MLVALLEHGKPMTLAEIARAFATAGICSAEQALRSLKRCRPGRPPVYRDGERYDLDPHDEQLDLWAFRLGLRPPKVPALRLVPMPPKPLPDSSVPLSVPEVRDAFRGGWVGNWSAQRIALAILDAHGGHMRDTDVIAFADRYCDPHQLAVERAGLWRSGAIVVNGERWSVASEHKALLSARDAIRKLIDTARRSHNAGDPAVRRALDRYLDKKRSEHAHRLASLRRVIVHAFPTADPRAVVLVDIAGRRIDTYVFDEVDEARARLAEYDWIGGVDVRPTLRGLNLEPSHYRVAELGPPQKSLSLNRRGRALKLTPSLLVQGSCAISRPFGDPQKLRVYLDSPNKTRLRRRLEADAKSLFALYQYGRLHGAVRVRWGFVDDMVPVPWVHYDEPTLYDLKRQALAAESALEVVTGSAPGWSDPWARSHLCAVVRIDNFFELLLVDASGQVVDSRDVQLARLAIY